MGYSRKVEYVTKGKDVESDDNIGDVPWFSTVTKSAVPMQCLHSR